MTTSKSSGTVRTVQGDTLFVRKVLITIAVVGLALLLWRLREIALLLFGAIVIAAILHSLTSPICRYTPLPRKWAVMTSILLVALISAVAFWFAGAKVSAEFTDLADELPKAWEAFRTKVESYSLGKYFFSQVAALKSDGGSALSKLSLVVMSVAGSITDLILVLVGGFYFAIDPACYRDGMLRLFPKSKRPIAAEALDSTGASLNRWIMAKIAEMVIVGLLTTTGLLIIGLPSAVALGLVAGIAEFVPFVGLIVAVIPAALIALSMGPEMLLLTALVYTVVQQLEGNLILPFIEQKIVYVPPVLTIFSIVVFGLLFGPLGVIFAAPLVVAVMVLVRKFYMEAVLGEPVSKIQ